MACNRPFPFMLALLLMLIAAFDLQAAAATTCKATSTSSTSLATNITTTHSRLFCSSSDESGEPIFLRCSANATFTPTAINSSIAIAAETAYSCYLKNTSASALVNKGKLDAPYLTSHCSGLFTTSPIASTSSHTADQSNDTASVAMDGTDSCSIDIATQPVLHLDADATMHCVSTSAIASTHAKPTSTSFCSVVTLIRDGPATVFTQNSTYNCSTFIETTAEMHPDPDVLRSYSVCFLNTTDLANTSTTQYTHKEAFAHGGLFPFT